MFMNETVQDYCQAAGVAFTRCRPYRKNDQAWVEQKNGAVVRRIVGYRRFEGLEAAAALARLYAAVRLFVNFFQPSFKLAEKERDGAKVKKRYHPPATPYQRLLADPRTSEEVRRRVERDLRHVGSGASAAANPRRRSSSWSRSPISRAPANAASAAAPTLEQFLSGLRTAWKEGEVRPTARAKPKIKRLRRRADPLAAVSEQLRVWFEAEPERTGRELLERLQAAHPGIYPDGQLRTLQRRLKIWRSEMAHKMVFGAAQRVGHEEIGEATERCLEATEAST